MSQFTPPPPPLGYATALPQPIRRPTTVTVVAILAIVFGGIGLLASACTIPQWLGFRLTPNPVQDSLQKDPVILSTMLSSMAVNLVLYVMMLVGGIRSLSLKPSGRAWLIRYAVVHIITTLLTLTVGAIFLYARNQAALQKALAQNPQLNTPQMKMIMQYSYIGGYFCAGVFLIWPVLILYYMNRPHIKAAFAGVLYESQSREPFA